MPAASKKMADTTEHSATFRPENVLAVLPNPTEDNVPGGRIKHCGPNLPKVRVANAGTVISLTFVKSVRAISKRMSPGLNSSINSVPPLFTSPAN